MDDIERAVSTFACLGCGEPTTIARDEEPEASISCVGCGAHLGTFSQLDDRRRERRFILTGRVHPED